MEAFDCFGSLRAKVFGPLMHIKNGNLPREVRKVESKLEKQDLELLTLTIPTYNSVSLWDRVSNSVSLYRMLRDCLFDRTLNRQKATEQQVMNYLQYIKGRK